MDKWEDKEINEVENKLIKGCVKWDRSAQNKLYNMFSAKMFAVCNRYSESREEAEDTFHEGFMKVFENINSFRREGSLEGWIRRIMVNTALRKYQKKSRSFEVVRIDDNAAIEKDLNQYYSDEIISQMEVNKIMKLIDQLPPAYKLVFNLYEFEGFKHHEIAEKLGISEGTSKSNLSRAKAILQNAINSEKIKSEQIN